MACSSERSRELGDLAAGRLDAGAAGALLEHLAGCAECSAELDLVGDLVTAAEARGSEIFEAPPAAWWSRPRVWIPAVAASVLLLVWLRLDIGDNAGTGERQLRAELAELATTTPLGVFGATLRSSDPIVSRDYRAALDLYRDREYEKAASILQSVSDDAPERHTAALYLGICRLQTGNPVAALVALESAARGRGLVRERGLWYQAQAHLLTGDGNAALEALRRLVDSDSDYAVNARELIQQIERAVRR